MLPYLSVCIRILRMYSSITRMHSYVILVGIRMSFVCIRIYAYVLVCIRILLFSAFAIFHSILVIDSAVIYVLIRTILFHHDVAQKSYNSLKLAQGGSKFWRPYFFMVVYL